MSFLRPFLAVVALCAATPAFAQSFKMLPDAEWSNPPGVKIQGKIITVKRWQDRNGINQLLLTQSGRVPDTGCTSDMPCVKAELHAYLLTRPLRGDNWRLAWQVRDFVTRCPLEVEASFLPNGLTVTDLDHDGIAEVTMVYRLACRGDISPTGLKLIMREGNDKYAIRGRTRVPSDNPDFRGGERNIDAAFQNGPAAFRTFALACWEKFVDEKSID